MTNTRAFFETELSGLFSWDSVMLHQPEKLPDLPSGRRNPEGKHQPLLKMRFGAFLLEVRSPAYEPDPAAGEKPEPLGLIRIEDTRTSEICQGPLDHEIWRRAGQFIKERMR